MNTAAVVVESVRDTVVRRRMPQQLCDAVIGRRSSAGKVAQYIHTRLDEGLQEKRTSSVLVDDDALVDEAVSESVLVLCRQRRIEVANHMQCGAKSSAHTWLAQHGKTSSSAGRSRFARSDSFCRQLQQGRRRSKRRQLHQLRVISHGRFGSGDRRNVLQSFGAIE